MLYRAKIADSHDVDRSHGICTGWSSKKAERGEDSSVRRDDHARHAEGTGNGGGMEATGALFNVNALFDLEGDINCYIQKFVSETSVPTDFPQPGHLFPLRARPGLLKERQGHTESSVELCILADVKPVAIIIEIMNDDGSMSRLPQLEELAKRFQLNIISIDEIIEHNYGKTI